MGDFIVGPNRCGACGGEYGGHAPGCNTLRRQRQAAIKQGESLRKNAASLAEAIGFGRSPAAVEEIENLLLDFADEIKRQATEP